MFPCNSHLCFKAVKAVKLIQESRRPIQWLNFCKLFTKAELAFEKSNSRNVHTSCSRQNVWDPGTRGNLTADRETAEVFKYWNDPKAVLQGLKIFGEECIKWKNEMKEKMDYIPYRRKGEIDMAFTFETEEKIKDFVITTDSSHKQGYSTASLITTPQETGLFSGNISTKLPQDGEIQHAGYASMLCHRKLKSFQRASYFDWEQYTHLVLKVRGDGRSYLIVLATPGYFDVTWNDQFHYILYTRGGPYWQISKIPFSKFYHNAKGRIQDQQYELDRQKVARFGFTLADKIDGPFSLEIDYVGLEYHPYHYEEFAYEQYRTPKNYPSS